MSEINSPLFPNDPVQWKRLGSRIVYECRPYLVVREDAVEVAPGRVIPNYFVFEYPEWVVVLGITTDQRFVLIRQYRHGIGGVHYELCAGTPDNGESMEEAAKREFLEETGYGGGNWHLWMTTSANPGTHTNRTHIFLAEGVSWQKDPALDDTEDITVHLLTEPELIAVLENEGIAQSIHAAALFKYLYKKSELHREHPVAESVDE